MPNKTRGVGLFTAENIVAVIRAIPESDGTYRDVARKAQQYGGNFHYHTISNWVSHGRADMEAGQPSTAYARFTKRYQDLIDEHCGPDTNRNRELDRAFEILERTCKCGNGEMLLRDGTLANTCRNCQGLDDQGPSAGGRDESTGPAGPAGVQPKVEGLQRQGLGYSESGPPLRQDQQSGLGVRRGRNQRVDVRGFQVLRQGETFSSRSLLQSVPFCVHAARSPPTAGQGHHGPECHKIPNFVVGEAYVNRTASPRFTITEA